MSGLLKRHQVRRESAALASSAASSADLAAVILGGGGTVPDVVEAVATMGPSRVQPYFGAVIDRVAAGELWTDSLMMELSDLGPGFHPLVGALVMADRGGAPIGSILQHLSDDARRVRQMDSERAAKELSVRLLIPLVVALLPAVLIGTVVPIVMVALSEVRLAP